MGDNKKEKKDWKKIASDLKSDVEKGLSEKESKVRLEKYGFNEIPEKEESIFQRIIKRLWGPIPWMIEIAAILSAVAKKWDDFTIIVILLLVNVIIDFAQEAKALSALKVLKNTLAKKALVKRNGKFVEIEAKFLVPGDIIKLKIGDVVPADVVLIGGEFVQIDQAALTGESLPVHKSVGDIAYSNSVIKVGEMEAIVTETAMNTYFGKSASLVIKAGKEQKSHFQKAVLKIGNWLIMLTICLAIILIIVSLFRHDPIMEVLRFILVLVVASIPVAMPAVLSVTMAIGAINLAKKQAIVSRLAAIEEIAGVSVLCSDKTGTLTQNKMSTADPVLFHDFTEQDLYLYAALASKKENKDPIEIPIFEKIDKLKLKDKITEFTQEKFTPFDPVIKRTVADIQNHSEKFTVTKGAPQIIASLCEDEKLEKEIHQKVYEFAKKGYRTIGVAKKNEKEKSFDFIGLIPLFDPPRTDSKSTIAKAKKLGLQVKMITGDNQAIAKEIASLLNIGENILDTQELRHEGANKELSILAEVIGGALYKKLAPKSTEQEIKHFQDDLVEEVVKELKEANLPHGHIRKHESQIIETIENADGFSQVFPEDKYFIIDELQKADYIVAMTGDGVNDAPALKKADAGIAVSGATDAARAAADVVLIAPGLSVIINAITEARLVFERMKSYATFRISETIRVILFMSLSIIVFNFYPLTAIMIILLALLNDIPIMMIAYDNAETSKKPVRWNMREVMLVAAAVGFAGLIESFILFYYLEEHHFPEHIIQTLMFLKLSVDGHSTLYLTRTWDKHFWKKPYPSPKLFIPTFSTQILATFFAAYGLLMPAIGWKYAGFIWAYAVVCFTVNNFVKMGAFKLLRRKTKKL
ncbi:plasma-membrane proton-efflux P-type ATPase [Aureivirga marina]|uniref:plasma-membrane proton-efflux P-type ATPase n=1 Tax=Aureivirga marina TaxID=1182451 RepID=UPI0018CA9D97|nr:plasma-membrane proton-efflux P-type ATPase [Aureivirga marina]